MRIVLAGCALLLACSVEPASAQEGWPLSVFKQPARKPPPKKANPTTPPNGPATALLDPQQPQPQPDSADGKPASGSAPPDPASAPATPQPPAATVPPAPPPAAVPSQAGAKAVASWPWRILRTTWTERDEKGYEEFIQLIGESGCRSVHACLTGAVSNPLYRASNPAGMTFYADCADLPYMLRAYFAWKNGLPFSYSTAVTPIGYSRDIRYTAQGNLISTRRDLVEGDLDGRKALPQIVGTISSAHYRYPPNYTGKLLPDHYPVKIARDSIKPGTIIYDPNGHVAVIYKVTPEGRIHYIDTHPDNSLTRGVYGKAFARSSPGMGAGFKRWRPQTLVGAAQSADGALRGGQIRLAADKDIPDWSDEQFYGNEPRRPKLWSAGKFMLESETLEYYDYVRRRLAIAGFKYDPLEETRSMVRSLCEDLKYRVDAVDVAIKAGIHKRPQPDKLPNNIYGTDGDWETYSTPSRDARLKTAFKELRDEVARFLSLAAAGNGRLAYAGENLRADIRRAYEQETSACAIAYTRSDSSQKQLSFADVQRRLFALSFDPHHCAERRWGAQDAEEAATCADGADKRAWYEAEQRLRNQPDRTYDARMGFGLVDLKRGVAGSGIDQPPVVDVLALLAEEPAGIRVKDASNGAARSSETGPPSAAPQTVR
jgi:hypothetical protein